MPPITVVVPWRPAPSRMWAFDALRHWYAEILPSAVLRPVDPVDPVFNLSQARNAGVSAVPDPHQVVVVNDADTLPEREPLLAAIDAAKASGLVHLPYTEYRWLGAEGTAMFASGAALSDCPFELVRGACSGVYVTTPATWWSHGGQDEGFRGWGFEDAAWFLAHDTLLGSAPARHEGRVYALHHAPETRSGPLYDANESRMRRYRDAARNPDAMRQLVAEVRTSAS